jgi:hypothetical protein
LKGFAEDAKSVAESVQGAVNDRSDQAFGIAALEGLPQNAFARSGSA